MSIQSKNLAVLISDIHFTPSTLRLASTCLRAAIDKAQALRVPLIIAGDLLDSKAIIRGECANELIGIFEEAAYASMIYILVGNHDLLNERGEGHSLNFLRPYANVVDKPLYLGSINAHLVPYFSDSAKLQKYLDRVVPKSRLIMHQGLQTAYMGHYVQDKTSLPPEAFANFRVISGHYHRAQDIKCGRPQKGAVGLFTYLGSPYSQSFAEANDPEKGFAILQSDGLLKRVPVPLRRHVVIETHVEDLKTGVDVNLASDDLLWLKVTGPYSELEKLDKNAIGKRLLGHADFKFEKIPTDAAKPVAPKNQQTGEEIMDSLIDALDESEEQKGYLKELWREVIEAR